MPALLPWSGFAVESSGLPQLSGAPQTHLSATRHLDPCGALPTDAGADHNGHFRTSIGWLRQTQASPYSKPLDLGEMT